jgi:nucleotide-binding universal stress UspA family protein
MNSVLALVDLSASTHCLLHSACKIAAMMNCPLILLHVASDDGVSLNRIARAAEFRRRHVALQRWEHELREQGAEVRSMMVRGRSMRGNPVNKIMGNAKRLRPKLIVAVPHRRTRLSEMITWSVTRSLMRWGGCPILLVPEEQLQKSGQ